MLEILIEYLENIDFNNIYQIMKTTIETKFDTQIQSPESMVTALLILGTIGYFIFDVVKKIIPIIVIALVLYVLGTQ